jgi:NADPH:quinone reductase-like Zn-dependent oxidoreductase
MTETIHTRQFWIRSPGQGAVVDHAIAPPGPGELLVEASYSGISRGTEALVFSGSVPESQHDAMRAPFQEGSFPGPVKYGYSSVGTVSRAPDAPELEGKAVFCLFPHQDRYVVPVAAVVPLPEGVPEGRAVLGANMETALNVVWDAEVAPGDRVLIVGGGVVGLLVAWISGGIPGSEVLLVDVDPSRAGVVAALGVSFAPTVPTGFDADVVVHASGSPEGVAAALGGAGVEARVVEASWFGDRSVGLPLGEAFHARRITLRSSQVGRIPPERAPRWTHRRRIEKALELLRAPTLDRLVTGESPLDELPGVLRRLAEEPAGALCHRIRYRPG